MNRDVVLERSVSVGSRICPDVHAAGSRLTTAEGISECPKKLQGDILRRSGKVGVVSSSRILNGNEDTVVSYSTLAVVGDLEVVRCLCETIAVGDIMEGVDQVESVDTRSVDTSARSSAEVVCIVEDESFSGLRSEIGVGSAVSDDVIPSGGGVIGSSVVVPAERGRGEIGWVRDILDAFGESKLVDRKDAVLDTVFNNGKAKTREGNSRWHQQRNR